MYIIFVLIIQQVEGDLIYPRVVGDSIGLPSMWVLFAVTVGAGLMGIPGMLLGVPFLASIYKILKLDVRYRETLKANSANQEDTDHVKFLDSLRHHLLTNDEIDRL
ncbi:AI-2E family transporter [Aerococcus sp. 1KP-2016]|uniref:AI-2E family transporter n=1 Tax=Aerococcus sp. 1KP-2016 TaxID=1981982 RepID=UPI0021017693|nr:AI-2E family transporter [Aerococcus sp. 1KP-2016]